MAIDLNTLKAPVPPTDLKRVELWLHDTDVALIAAALIAIGQPELASYVRIAASPRCRAQAEATANAR
jgi:hypothetical protein